MSLEAFPNEMLVKIFQKLRPMDVKHVKLVNERFRSLVERCVAQYPTATTLQIISSQNRPSLIEVIATLTVPFKKAQRRRRSIKTEVTEKPEEKYKKIADAILELEISGYEQLMFDSITANLDLNCILDKAGLDNRELKVVKNARPANDITTVTKISLPFLNDSWLADIERQNFTIISLEKTITKISMTRIIKFFEERVRRDEKYETFYFGRIEMTTKDHDLIKRLKFVSDILKEAAILQKDNHCRIIIGLKSCMWTSGEKAKRT